MYTVKEAAEILGMNSHTVRYYANMDLIPTLKRDQNGKCLFDEDGIAYLQGVSFCGTAACPLMRSGSILIWYGSETAQKRRSQTCRIK